MGPKVGTTPENQPPSSSSSSPSASSSAPWPASSWPRPSGSSSPAPVCRECRGRGVISSAAGPLPCPACISWRRRPEYKPGQALLSVQDLNLNSLDQTPLSSPSSEEVGGNSGMVRNIGDLGNSSNGGSNSLAEDANASSSKPKDRRGQNMTEQKRLAIKMAMQGRGPLDSDHKRRISNAMRERYASDPSLRQAGKPKKCSHCGQLGHNRKKCPELLESSSTSGITSGGSDEESEGEELLGVETKISKVDEIDGTLEKLETTSAAAASTGTVKTCSVCGEPGHNKRSCPQLIAQQQQQQEQQEQQQQEQATPAPTPAKVEQSILPEQQQQQQRQQQQQKQKQGPLIVYPSSPPPSMPTLNTDPKQPIKTVPPSLRALPGSNLSLAEDGSLVFPLPCNPEQCVAQAAGAVIRAWSDGIRRQTMELLLPQADSDAAEGWPGGIRQQFRAALPMIESLLLRLKRAEGLEGRITAEWVDEGDCVGAWQSEKLAAVVFPTADSLTEVRRIDDALSGNRLMLVVNPQWQPQGQVVSDFGFGRTRRAAERYVASLDEIYYLRRIRVLGDEVRVLRCYPSRWQVHYVRAAGDTELISVEQEKPTYQRVLEILKGVRDSRASKSWFDRALDRNWYDDIAAYNEGSPQKQEEEEQEGEDEDSGRSESGGGVVVRDIVTGEIISTSGGISGKDRF
jgi:Domain of unknown function (DUF1995)